MTESDQIARHHHPVRSLFKEGSDPLETVLEHLTNIRSERVRPLFQQAVRPAFTLVELLVVIAIIGVLIGMSIPAMQNMRELSRRSNCEQNLVRLSLALASYSTRHQHYPIGTQARQGPIVNVRQGYHHNWISALLPALDTSTVYAAIDFSSGVYADSNDNVRRVRLPALLCPSASDIRENTSTYAGIHASTEVPIDEDNDGVFVLNLAISDDDISDGLGYTMFLGEKLSGWDEDFGWMSGTRSTLRNAGHPINAERKRIRVAADAAAPGYVGGLASDHPGGAYILLGSGEYRFCSGSIDPLVLRQLASRADGAIPAELMTVDFVDEASADQPAAAEEDASADAESDEGDR